MAPELAGIVALAILQVLTSIFIIVVGIRLMVSMLRSARAAREKLDLLAPPETAREILDKRYARGEITREQYDEMKRTLGAG